MAATTKPRVTEGPALFAAAAAVLTNNPAPIIAPIPSAIRLPAVSVLFNPPRPSSLSMIRSLMGFLTNKVDFIDRV